MEIEADYMWGLLHPCLLAGEGGYYLTTLSSAVHVLKSLIANSKSDSYLKSVSTNNRYYLLRTGTRIINDLGVEFII